MIYKLNFSNGNVQEYDDYANMQRAVEKMGGKAERLGTSNTFVFVQVLTKQRN